MAAAERSKRAHIAGTRVDLLSMRESVETCRRLIESRRPAQHVVVNASKAVQAADDPVLRALIEDADVVNADGQSVVWAGRLRGIPVPERVAGIDLMRELLALAEREGYPVYFLGATQEALDGACRRARADCPRLIVAGSHHGYFADDAAVAGRIRDSGARLLFVGMPSPRKEHFVAENLHNMGALLAVGVGGSFDVLAGHVRRAPVWMQRAGLEWLYRFGQEPRRMWRRYLLGNARFVALAVRCRAETPSATPVRAS